MFSKDCIYFGQIAFGMTMIGQMKVNLIVYVINVDREGMYVLIDSLN